MNTKKCYRCCKEKPASDFLSMKRAALCAPCREYANGAARQWYADGKYKNYEDQREYRLQLFDQQLPEGQRRCRTCLHVKTSGEFATTNGESKHCNGCREKRRAWMRESRARWSEERKEKLAAKLKSIRDGRKRQVIDAYGGRCVCCKEIAIEFLSIDHINKDGAIDRRENGSNGFYRRIIKLGFPSHFRVLCFNCNWSIGVYGYCPHQQYEQHPIDQALRTMPMVGMVN